MTIKDTRAHLITRGAPNQYGWRSLVNSQGEEFVDDTVSEKANCLLSLIHISDLHICDAQSPARVELLDRYADPHHPFSEMVKLVGTYRAQEIMTTQTLEAMIRAINEIHHGPITQRPIDAVVVTGDVTDNAQTNELAWYLTLLDGGTVNPDSGNTEQWEGVASSNSVTYDASYWNPEGTPDGCEPDYPRSLYGFPTFPGLTNAVRKPFQALGLVHRWYATHGNHDALLQGTVPPNDELRAFAKGNRRLSKLSPDINVLSLFEDFSMVGPANYPSESGASFTSITADESRNFNYENTWAELHTSCSHDHGLDQSNLQTSTKYWFRDINGMRLISMDTVNPHGGWQGSIDREQFEWIRSLLADKMPRYFIFLSHHPASTLFNLYSPPDTDQRVGEEELVSELVKDERVILWLAGHNHQHKIDLIRRENFRGFWHIQTSSNIDWPQQGRTVEILQDGDEVVVATTVFNHQGLVADDYSNEDLSDPIVLAGISRVLAGNDWQRRAGEFNVELMAGSLRDRNRILRF